MPEAVARVLVVDDHPPTAQLITEAIADIDETVAVDAVHDGQEAIELLQRDRSTTGPQLVLLDLDMPVADGFDVLEALDGDVTLRCVPVVILSGTDDDDTIRRCYENGANAYVPKPDDFESYRSVARTVLAFWFSTARMPLVMNDGVGTGWVENVDI